MDSFFKPGAQKAIRLADKSLFGWTTKLNMKNYQLKTVS